MPSCQDRWLPADDSYVTTACLVLLLLTSILCRQQNQRQLSEQVWGTPAPARQGKGAQFVCSRSATHGIWQVLLVGEH